MLLIIVWTEIELKSSLNCRQWMGHSGALEFHRRYAWHSWEIRGNSNEQGSSRGADSCSASQNMPALNRIPRFHYRVHISPPLVPVLSHLCQGLPNGFFHLGFPTKPLYAFVVFPMHITCPGHLDFVILIILSHVLVAIDGVWIGWLDLLTHYANQLVLTSIEALSLIYVIYSSPLHTR
jgi:hypothetical protein